MESAADGIAAAIGASFCIITAIWRSMSPTSVPGSGVSAGLDFDCVAVVGVVDSGLDVTEIGGRIVIDGDCPRLTGNCQKQTSKNKGHPFHF
jgi:hypothetical protein